MAQGNSPAPSPFSLDSLPELTATEAVALLCSRQITAVEYVQSLLDRLDSGWECLNAFSTINTTQVGGSCTRLCKLWLSGKLRHLHSICRHC